MLTKIKHFLFVIEQLTDETIPVFLKFVFVLLIVNFSVILLAAISFIAIDIYIYLMNH